MYRNAVDTTKGGWAVTDKIFGYLDKAGDIYNEVRYPKPGEAGYEAYLKQKQADTTGIFGLPNPWGAVIIVAGISLLAFGIYKIAS